MALITKEGELTKLVELFYKAQCAEEKQTVTINDLVVRSMVISHGRLMIVGEHFPIDFIIQPYELKCKEACNEHVYDIAKCITRMFDADYLLNVATNALKEDGLSVEVVGDKVIMNKLTASVGEDDQQPTGKLSSSFFAEFPPEEGEGQLPPSE